MDVDPNREVTPPRPSLMELSVAIAPWTHIKQIRLTRSTIQSKSIDVTETSQLQFSFDATTVLDREAGTLTVCTSLAVSAGEFVRIDADFALDYSVEKSIPITDEVATAFGRMNGIHNLWPYWREYVQSMSMRVGLPPITLPLMTGASMLAYYGEKDKPSTPQIAHPQEETGLHLGGAPSFIIRRKRNVGRSPRPRPLSQREGGRFA